MDTAICDMKILVDSNKVGVSKVVPLKNINFNIPGMQSLEPSNRTINSEKDQMNFTIDES
jgi:hypothetical protein